VQHTAQIQQRKRPLAQQQRLLRFRCGAEEAVLPVLMETHGPRHVTQRRRGDVFVLSIEFPYVFPDRTTPLTTMEPLKTQTKPNTYEPFVVPISRPNGLAVPLPGNAQGLAWAWPLRNLLFLLRFVLFTRHARPYNLWQSMEQKHNGTTPQPKGNGIAGHAQIGIVAVIGYGGPPIKYIARRRRPGVARINVLAGARGHVARGPLLRPRSSG